MIEPLAQAAEHLPFKQGVPGSIPGWLTIIRPVGQAVKTSPFHGGIMGSIPVRVTSYVSRKCLFYGVCEFFFCSISALPLIFENCHLHCHLCFCKRLFFISKRKCISNRFAVSRLSFLKHMTVDITRCSYAGMSHIT